MANFSRDTFENAKIKHYISVRLQQGVPLVDADWNEMEDIRRFELQAFLKWFVGDGVPAGNDGFRIQPLTNIVFSVTTPGVTFKVKASDAAAELGLATETATSHLEGTTHEPFDLRDTKLAIEFTLKGARLSAIVQVFEITFASASFHDIAAATASEVADAINQAISAELTKLNSALSFASVANGNDFVIGGGDGTPAGAGRCLVEGWDVLNENDRRYQAQKLYNNSTLAAAWNVDVLPPLTPPDGERTDLVYLDVWERVVDAEEDPKLVNPAIGIETCARLKREWVVRVLEDCDEREVPVNWPLQQKERSLRKSGHVYYALAQLQRKAQQTLIEPSMITDLRRTGLMVPPNLDTKQIITDAYGLDYKLNGNGQPNLKVSLREAINAILKGGLPSTTKAQLASNLRNESPASIRDSAGNVSVFFTKQTTSGSQIWYRYYDANIRVWGSEQPIIQLEVSSNSQPMAFVDAHRGVSYLVWTSKRVDNTGRTVTSICFTYRLPGADAWSTDIVQVANTADPNTILWFPSVLVDAKDNTWIFWYRTIGSSTSLFCRTYEFTNYLRSSDEMLIVKDAQINDLKQQQVAVVYNETVWAFWVDNLKEIFYQRTGGQSWPPPVSFLKVQSDSEDINYVLPLCDRKGDLWVFWSGHKNGKGGIWYRKCSPNTDWAEEVALNIDIGDVTLSNVFQDGRGDIWVCWVKRDRGTYYFYKRYNPDAYWGREVESPNLLNSVIADDAGDVWVFWNKEFTLWNRKLVSSI